MNGSMEKAKVIWWPLVFTPFIAFVFLDPYQRGARGLEWTLTSLAVLAFLVLYAYGLLTAFRRQRHKALAALAAISALGLAALDVGWGEPELAVGSLA
jgi:hypothetical protein